MKKIILLFLIMALLSLIVTPCFADSAASVEVSNKSALTYIHSLNNYFTLNTSFITNNDSNTYDLGTSFDGNYTVSKKEFNDLQLGCDLDWFPFSKVFFIGKGLYFVDRETIITKYPTDPEDSGLPYVKDKSNNAHFKSPWSAGFQFDTKNFIFGFGYHEMTKWYAQIAFHLGDKKSEE